MNKKNSTKTRRLPTVAFCVGLVISALNQIQAIDTTGIITASKPTTTGSTTSGLIVGNTTTTPVTTAATVTAVTTPTVPTATPTTTSNTIVSSTTTPTTPPAVATTTTPVTSTDTIVSTTTATPSPASTTPSITAGIISNNSSGTTSTVTPTAIPSTTTAAVEEKKNSLDANLDSKEINKNAPVITIKVGETYTFNAPESTKILPTQEMLDKKKTTEKLYSTVINATSSNNDKTLVINAERYSTPNEEPYPIIVKKDDKYTTIARVRVIQK